MLTAANAQRLLFFSNATVAIVLGICSRRYRSYLPNFIAEYAGDTLWALMLYFLLSAVFPSFRIRTRLLVAFAIACMVEVSQLYKADWIDSVRSSALGGLVLGYGFLWTDIVCYSLGTLTGAFIDSVLIQPIRDKSDKSS